LSEGKKDVRVALGIHPNEADCYDEKTFGLLRKLAADERVVGIGETGLDFYRDSARKETQFASFHAHLDLAHELGKPFILHCRAAEKEMLDVLEVHSKKTGGTLNGVWHCFTASKEFGLRAAALGLYFGIGGVVTYPKAEDVRTALAALPGDRIVLETDAPFLAPVPFRGKRNESSYLRHVVEKIAHVRDAEPETIERETDDNARRLFKHLPG
jgi:TatD DNase family protein